MKIVCFKNITHSIYFTPWHTEIFQRLISWEWYIFRPYSLIIFFIFLNVLSTPTVYFWIFLKIFFADRAFLMVTWRPRPFSKKLPPWIFFIKIIPESHFNQRIASNKSLHRNIKFMPQGPALNCHVGDRKILISPKYIQN